MVMDIISLIMVNILQYKAYPTIILYTITKVIFQLYLNKK